MKENSGGGTPFARRPRLGSAREVRREEARLYTEALNGERPAQDAARLANILELIRRSIETDVLEADIAALRAELAQRAAANGARG